MLASVVDRTCADVQPRLQMYSLVCISGYVETNISHPVTCATCIAGHPEPGEAEKCK